MKKLILKFLFLCSLFILVLMTVTLLCFYQNKKQVNHISLSKNIEKLYIGDSHIQKGINDSLIHNAISLGMTSEATIFSFHKLLKILQNNPQIKKVYLGYGYHNMSIFYDDCIFRNYTSDISTRYMCMLPDSLNKKIWLGSPKKWFQSLHKLYIRSVKNTFSQDPKSLAYFGGYENKYLNTKADEKILRKRAQEQYHDADRVYALSQIQIQSLQQIQALCTAQHIELYILNTPMDSLYKTLIPATYIQHYDSLMSTLQLQVIDFHELSFSKEDFIPDGDHVSATGARKISQFLEKNF